MAEINQFGSASPGPGFSPDCQRCERELTDALDGTLSPEEQAGFDAHIASCPDCQEMLADARRGVAWLEMLRVHRPEPPSDLVDRILTRTTGFAAPSQILPVSSPAELALPLIEPAFAGQPTAVLPFVRRPDRTRPSLSALLQTRFAMTAAMAFFSVALTLNLTGLHLSDVRARDLRPSSLRRDASELNAHVLRYYESLRVVYELESRVRDLQHSGDQDPAPEPRSLQQSDPPQDSHGAPRTNAPSTPSDKAAPDSNSSQTGGGRSHSTNESPSHDTSPVGALPHSAPGGGPRSLPSSPTPGPATPVTFHISRPHWQKGFRA